MFKRIALTLTFVAAFSMAAFSFTTPAQAWRSWGRPYSAYYYGAPRPYYGYYAPYYGGPVYSPRVYRPYYAPRVYRSYYAPSYYYAPGPGVSVAVGF